MPLDSDTYGLLQGELDDPYTAFESAVERRLGPALRLSDPLCEQLWSALANIEWTSEIYGTIGYTFRSAGSMIAEIKGSGNYMHWYCSGDPGVVSPDIAEALEKEGWTYAQYKFT